MILERENCPMRHKENGNCLPMGGFCTANGDEMCKALHNAYRSGRIDFQRELQGVVGKEKYDKLLRAARRMHESKDVFVRRSEKDKEKSSDKGVAL